MTDTQLQEQFVYYLGEIIDHKISVGWFDEDDTEYTVHGAIYEDTGFSIPTMFNIKKQAFNTWLSKSQ